MKIKKLKKGSALVYGLVIMSATLVILMSMISYITSQVNFSLNRAEKEEALQIAEAGIFWYRWYLAHEVDGKTAQQVNDFWQNESPIGVDSSYEQDFKDPEGGVIGRYSISVEKPSVNSTIAIVQSTGWTLKEPSMKRTVQVRFRRPSWSEYAILANDFMRFGEGTDVYGKIHSNQGIRFDGLAHNTVTSLPANYNDPDHSGDVEFGVHTHVNPPPATGINNYFRPNEAPPNEIPIRTDVFMAGREVGIPEVSFSGVLSDLSFMKEKAQDPSYGLYFDDSYYGRHIILKTDGTMDVKNVLSYDSSSNSITSESASTNYSIPEGGVVFVENNIWVEGTVNGESVTIVAANLMGGSSANIYIGMGNILYTNTDGSDIVGLIAQKDVEVIRDSLDFLTIDAALIAQSGRVGREHYGSWCSESHQERQCFLFWCWDVTVCDDWTTDHKDTITVNGSIATNLRYGFAYTDGTGYTNRNLNFDNNLLYYPPPFFPTGTSYFIDLWEEL